MNVDLPAPLLPIIPSFSYRAKVYVKLSKIILSPKRFEIPSASNIFDPIYDEFTSRLTFRSVKST